MMPPRSAISSRILRSSVHSDAVAVSGPFVILVLAVAASLNIAAWVILTQTEVESVVLDPVAAATFGVIQPTLFVYAILGAVIGYLFWLRGLSLKAIGLSRGGLGVALMLVGGIWLVAQAITIIVALVTTGSVMPSQTLLTGGIGMLVGLLLAQVLGNALYEEVVYRGFLLTTLHAGFESRKTSWPFITALVLSQTAFALVHVPSRLVEGIGGVSLATNLVFVFAIGIGFALLYYRTRNLYLVIGVHSLLNYPTVAFGSDAVASLTVAILSVTVFAVWPAIERRLPVSVLDTVEQSADVRPRL